MKTFIMTAECQPKNHGEWFSDFKEGAEFEAESQDKAQGWLDNQCVEAGTDDDPHWGNYGPMAKEV